MFRMVSMGIFNTLLKFENQLLSYKQDTEFKILCFVNIAQALLLFMCHIALSFNQMLFSSVDDIIYEHIESVYLVCHESFCQRNGSSILYIICKQL